MKRIKLTADFQTTITREFEVDDDFDPHTKDLDDLWYSNSGGHLTRGELRDAMANLEMDEVWRVTDENDNEIYVR